MRPRIQFYETNRPYGGFSNFARFPIAIAGVTWPTSEHFYQAAKFLDASDRDEVRAAPTPMVAARIGRDRRRPIRPDWGEVREAAMVEALEAKFGQHPDLREVLLSTGDAELVEHTSNDAWWGDGGDGSGRNRLGALLMALRTRLEPRPKPFLVPPWVRYPGVDVSDLHWRMGVGEDWWTAWARWRDGLGPSARREYDAYFPVPEAWRRAV